MKIAITRPLTACLGSLGLLLAGCGGGSGGAALTPGRVSLGSIEPSPMVSPDPIIYWEPVDADPTGAPAASDGASDGDPAIPPATSDGTSDGSTGDVPADGSGEVPVIGDPNTSQAYHLAGYRLLATGLAFQYSAEHEPAEVSKSASRALRSAMSTWEDALGTKKLLRLANLNPKQRRSTPTEPVADGVSSIGWASLGTVGTGEPMLAQLVVQVVDGFVVEADLYLNADEPWQVNRSIREGDPNAAGDPAAYDLQSLLTHQLGHVLGLADVELDDALDGNEADSTMYRSLGKGDVYAQTLTPGDLAGLAQVRPQ
jgi:hypothetical protein